VTPGSHLSKLKSIILKISLWRGLKMHVSNISSTPPNNARIQTSTKRRWKFSSVYIWNFWVFLIIQFKSKLSSFCICLHVTTSKTVFLHLTKIHSIHEHILLYVFSWNIQSEQWKTIIYYTWFLEYTISTYFYVYRSIAPNAKGLAGILKLENLSAKLMFGFKRLLVKFL